MIDSITFEVLPKILSNTEKKEILILEKHVLSTSNSADYSSEHLNVVFDSLDSYLQFRPRFSTIVAKEGDRIIGVITASARDGVIIAAYVHPSYQKSGIGQKLLQDIETLILDSDNHSNYVWLVSSITAQPFFEKNGYKTLIRRTKTQGNLTVSLMRKILSKKLEAKHITKDITLTILYRLYAILFWLKLLR